MQYNNLKDGKEAINGFLENLTGEDVERFDLAGFKKWAADQVYEPDVTFWDEYTAWAEQNDREDNFDYVYEFFK